MTRGPFGVGISSPYGGVNLRALPRPGCGRNTVAVGATLRRACPRPDRGSCVRARPWTSGDARRTQRLESATESQPPRQCVRLIFVGAVRSPCHCESLSRCAANVGKKQDMVGCGLMLAPTAMAEHSLVHLCPFVESGSGVDGGVIGEAGPQSRSRLSRLGEYLGTLSTSGSGP